MSFFKRIGSEDNRRFIRRVLTLMIPVLIQNGITNFVGLLDNIMIGRVGTDQMSGVSIVNQLMFVFNLCVFGGISGAGIFSAQYYGANNQEGVRHCFRYKLYLSAVLIVAAATIFLTRGEYLIGRFLHDEADPGRVAATLGYGMDYLRVMLWGMLPFALTQSYASTLRECGETRLPMTAGIVAVFVNLVFNYLLIFGHLGFPKLGVQGAAVATVLSRFVELAFVVIGTHAHTDRYPFARGAFSSPRVPGPLARRITVKGMPLLVNEFLWSFGMTMLVQCYSVRGLDVVAAMNISSTVSNLFSVAILSMGAATSIIVGQSLGASDMAGAKDRAWKLVAFSLGLSAATLVLMLVIAPLIPRVYQTSDAVRQLATRFLWIYAFCLPLVSFCNSAYFILRSGGKTLITFLFDSGYTWLISVPVAWCLVHLTSLPVTTIYLLVQLAEIIKCIFGYVLLRRGVWMNNIVA
jgi:putative MATE family efflux protein